MNWVDTALLYARTVRYLRPKQVAFRLVRELQRCELWPSLGVSDAGARMSPERFERLSNVFAKELFGNRDQRSDVSTADRISKGEFEFLNHEEVLPKVDWRRRYVSHLWNYNLHYFDYARALASAFLATGEARYVRVFEDLATGWIAGTEMGLGDGWEPYPTSLRVVNWIYASCAFGGSLGKAAREQVNGSLAQQLGFLERRLEYHVLANHLLKNYKALVVGGALFEGSAADRWRTKGELGFWAELEDQVNADGMHYERSPLYHVVALADYLEILLLHDALGLASRVEHTRRIESMIDATGVVCRPEGPLHLFHDSANNAAPPLAEISAHGIAALGRGVPRRNGAFELGDSGYYGYASRGGEVRMLIDAGAPAPPYQPGHSHCSLLSFELDISSRAFVVDSGVHGYEGDPFREYVRSTRAHNTVTINQRDQSEIWGTFRMARRARRVTGSGRIIGDQYEFQGSYVPYHDSCAQHHRRVRGFATSWRIEDIVEGAPGSRLDSYLHIHPDWEVVTHEDGLIALCEGIRVEIVPFGVDHWRIVRGDWGPPVQGWYCPEFGKAVASPTIEMTVTVNRNAPFGYAIEWHEDVQERSDSL